MNRIRSNQNCQNLIITINSKLANLKLNNYDKQTILDFIYLFNLINSKEFIPQILHNLRDIMNQENEINESELILKLENLISKINAKKYISKTENEYLKSYTYSNKHEIYFLKKIDTRFLINYIINTLRYQTFYEKDIQWVKINTIELFLKDKSKYNPILFDFNKIINFEYDNNNTRIGLNLDLEMLFKLTCVTDYEYSALKLRLKF